MKKNFGLFIVIISLFAVLGFSEQKKLVLSKGTVHIIERNNVKVHTYLSNDVLHATNIIESKNKLVLFDAQFTRPYAKDFRAYADSLGKPIERVIISHAHPDHFFGLGIAFKDIQDKIYSLEKTKQDIKSQGPGMIKFWKDKFKEGAMPEKIIAPTQTIKLGLNVIDNVRYEFVRVLNAETDEQLVIKLPDLGIVLVQDLIFNDIHLYMGYNALDGWITALEDLKSLSGYDIVIAGHGYPAKPNIIEKNIKYLKDVKKILTSANKPEDFKKQLIEKYPHYDEEMLIEISIAGLFKNKK